MRGAGEFVIVLYLVESFAFVSALFGLCLPNGGQLSRPEMEEVKRMLERMWRERGYWMKIRELRDRRFKIQDLFNKAYKCRLHNTSIFRTLQEPRKRT